MTVTVYTYDRRLNVVIAIKFFKNLKRAQAYTRRVNGAVIHEVTRNVR